MKTLLCTGLLAALALATPAAWAAEPFCGTNPHIARLQAERADPNGRILIAAHRGGHLAAPENSRAAIAEAIAEKADIIEIDVRVTTDGVPYVMHDRTLDRTTNGAGSNADITYAQLRALRLKGSAESPPTLQELLVKSCGKALVDLDMKTDKVAPVLAVVEGVGMAEQVILFDSESKTLRAGRRLVPEVPVMTRLRTDGPTLEEINRGLAPVAIVHGDPRSLTRAASAAIAALPARIWANALGETDAVLAQGDEAETCRRLADIRAMGVSVIQTDYPATLRKALRQCGISGR
ncbi:glycerophosphodiester phosphodiesterase family protein [Novosphingobium mangrovi (ex Hu et al. 2023)]|uniref:Glycerophosphodiester phosphodiesterase family protein n=1 Tax=Novosphingobium mangrovi (ex Hu et al. 2023) TaxID=2930094 RepID=A0ABT0ADN8_9SPHN|nr:glycerophosphodiester phosphodiesterase family protein [Novosphingobium mangrovi (ex Hu et al. 2023)]MCJ1961313.1 glycerophosphodiester phosphodiesterase family protein [Novosphingobium mangrovi (ex Hu et al. 2023)]